METRLCDPTKSSKNLCIECQSIPARIFYESKQPDVEYRHQHGQEHGQEHQLFEGVDALDKLKRSAEAGCKLCILFEDALRLCGYNPWEELRRQPEDCHTGLVLKGRDQYHDNIQIEFGSHSYYNLHVCISVERDGEGVESFWSGPLRKSGSYTIEPSADTPAAFALARSWLVECENNHAECIAVQRIDLPKRLLDIGQTSIRLASTGDLHAPGKSVRYATLSHCWGETSSKKPLKTMQQNLDTMQRGFPEQNLPPTFHDAVRVSRYLGLRYLWIDSLCIVQDVKVDFERECARMNSIYSNAVLTIAASDGENCEDGFLKPRSILPVTLTYEATPGDPKTDVKICPAWGVGLWGPLQSRAWVLQERHLSPRILHYTRRRLMWECRKCTASEKSREMAEIQWNKGRFLDGGKAALEHKGLKFENRNSFHEWHRRWYAIIEEYSRRRLSHWEDRLDALSGFAAEWKGINPDDEYMAGLWKSDLFRGLAWFPALYTNNIR